MVGIPSGQCREQRSTQNSIWQQHPLKFKGEINILSQKVEMTPAGSVNTEFGQKASDCRKNPKYPQREVPWKGIVGEEGGIEIQSKQ